VETSIFFEEGKKIIEDLTGKPVIGVLPYFRDIHIEEEDSVSLEKKFSNAQEGKINCAVILLPRMANFTDFSVLEHDPRVHLYYTNNIQEIENAEILIVPGSKNTISDLQELKNNGVANAIIKAHKNGKKVIGICGGYQMMGNVISDPKGIEGNIKQINGLGLLPIETVITDEKLTEQCQFLFKNYSSNCEGYEIHMGQSTALVPNKHLNTLSNGKQEGFILDDKCWGSYIHGILDNSTVINDLLSGFESIDKGEFDYKKFKEEQYDKLANAIRQSVDMKLFYEHLSQE
jgi:adenosylcobyric acid synthase (glutamine-hydrolysing) (EC 6.3.5.10)